VNSRRPRCRALAGVLLCFVAAVDAVVAELWSACEGTGVSIRSALPIESTLVCAGARDALGFFARLGFEPTHPIVIEVTLDLPGSVNDGAVGCYIDSTHRPIVIPRRAFLDQGTWFAVSVDDALYRGLVAHEVAHAVAACHFLPLRPTIQAQEYIAYVAMFATMDAGLRRRILAANPDPAFDSELKINATVYLCDPMAFAVRSYRHYLAAADGDAFIRRVLSGRALAD
jgi:hypothetical protein